jgi:hypothetical protein
VFLWKAFSACLVEQDFQWVLGRDGRGFGGRIGGELGLHKGLKVVK